MKLIKIVVLFLMLCSVIINRVQAGEIWEHPAGLFTLELPSGWSIEEGGGGTNYSLQGDGLKATLAFYPAKIVDINYFVSAINRQVNSLGYQAEWKEEKKEGREYKIFSLLTNSVTTGYCTRGDFIFELIIPGRGRELEERIIGLLEGIASDYTLEDPTGGNPQLLQCSWEVSQTDYSSSGKSSLGSTEKWTFYPDGTLQIYSFTSFQGSTYGDSYSSSYDETYTLYYWVVESNLYLFAEDGYIILPLTFGMGQIKVGEQAILTAAY